MERVYFITGVTGFLGAEILSLLAIDHANRFYCLIRANKDKNPQQRLDGTLSEIGFSGDDRINVVEGDIGAEKLGINEDDYKHLTKEITHIIHSAANVKFNQPIEKMRKINVEGTRYVLELAKDCQRDNPSFSHLNYIGTAFVAGKRKGIVGEDDLTDKFGFKNTYEQTKYEAEKLVRSYRDEGLPVMIFRPSIVAGVSERGKAKPRNVLYPMLELLSRLSLSWTPVNRKTRLDMVPVDFVAKAFVYISADERNIGKSFHLAAGPDGNIKIIRFLDLISTVFNQHTRTFPPILWKYIARPILKIIKPSMFVNNPFHAFQSYAWELSPTYSVEETRKALQGSGIELPDMERFLTTCIKYAKKTDFGREMPQE